ncbi:ABC transporter ATP-binding protein [Pasteurella sp. PK-2025]|uniref:ABC transporter ATP-binding protein n=1 Tax=unclassified Pasteurella TaxID=2621516 RepID=UPI003C70D9CE
MMLRLNEVCLKLAGQTIIQDFSMQVECGECVVLVGASGCGKTTLLRAIAGLIPVSFGDVLSVSKRLAYLFQEPRLLPWLSVRENLKLILPDLSEAQLFATLECLQLSPLDAEKLPDELSGGMKQRVALARALILQPDLLLMDEPFSALDSQLRHRLQDLIQHYIEQGLAVVLVTHDMQEAVRMAQRIYCVADSPAQNLSPIVFNTPYAQRDHTWQQQALLHPRLQELHQHNARLL